MQKTMKESFLYLYPTQLILFSWCQKKSHKTQLSPKYYFRLASKLGLISVFYSSKPLFDTLLACIPLHEVFISFESSFWTNTSKILPLFHDTFFEIFYWKTNVKKRTEIIHLECKCEDKLRVFDKVWSQGLTVRYLIVSWFAKILNFWKRERFVDNVS